MNDVKIRQRGYLLLIPSAALAVVVVFGLLFLMQALINADLKEPEETERINIGDIWQEKEEIDEQIKERKVEEIEEPEEQPDIPEQQLNFDADFDGIDISTAVAKADVDINLGGSFSDGDIIPLVAIQPVYPRRAAERGLEGYCVVSFTITTAGTTRDIAEEECTSSIFSSASIRAAEKLKYKPRIIDGRAVEVAHYYKFTYEIAQ
jgi:protein TonB